MGDSITNSDRANQKDIAVDRAYPAITPILCSLILASFMHTKRTDWERTSGGVVRGDKEATRQARPDWQRRGDNVARHGLSSAAVRGARWGQAMVASMSGCRGGVRAGHARRAQIGRLPPWRLVGVDLARANTMAA